MLPLYHANPKTLLHKRLTFGFTALAVGLWLAAYIFSYQYTGDNPYLIPCIEHQITCDISEFVPGNSDERIAMLREAGLSMYSVNSE